MENPPAAAAPLPASISGPGGPRPAHILALGCLGLALPVTAVLGALFLPRLLGGEQAAHERRATAALRALAIAQGRYRDEDRDANGARDYAPSLEALARAGLLDPELATGTTSGYAFVVERGDATAWSATATPIRAGESGERSFYLDSTGTIRARVPSLPREKARFTDPEYDARRGPG